MQTKTKIALVLVFLLAACAIPTTHTPIPPSPSPIPPIPPSPSAIPIMPASPSAIPPMPPSPSPLPPIATLPPLVLTPASPATGTLISLTQIGSFTSQPFTVTGKAFLRVNWREASTGKFTLILQNTDPIQSGTPNGDVTFDNTIGPHARFMEYPFIPGQYIIKVVSDGPWTVWVETIPAGSVPVP